MATQTGRCAVRGVGYSEHPIAADPNRRLDVIAAPSLGKMLEQRAFLGQTLLHPPIHVGGDFLDKGLICGQIAEVAVTPQHQRLIQGLLQSPLTGLNRSIFLGLPLIIGGGPQIVIPTQGGIPPGQLFVLGLIVIGRREVVRAVLLRNAAQAPEGIL